MKRIKNLFPLFFTFLIITPLTAQELPDNLIKTTMEFAQRDSTLFMDIYRLKGTEQDKQPVMLFVFGGAFISGERDSPFYNSYFYKLAENNITVVSIDYRLGLRGKKVTLFNTKAADEAINMAVEDLYSATLYLLQNAGELGIDPDCIMMSGSSAGAITVLQADYYLHNGMSPSDILPAEFRYQGVLSYAGAIFSHKGTPDYKISTPSPTLFFHGNKDKVVPYNKLRLFRRGMFGSGSLAKRFHKKGYNYLFLTMDRKGHSVAGSPMHDNQDIILWFIENYVYNRKNWQIKGCFNDQGAPTEKGGNMFNTVND